MVEKHVVEGIVVKSSTRKDVTDLSVAVDEGIEIPYVGYSGIGPHTFRVPGRHILGGKRVRVEYANHTGVLWVRGYEVFERDVSSDCPNRVIHQEILE